jgi:thiosulfate/3-mercaptopyruvate sulfurtransferase
MHRNAAARSALLIAPEELEPQLQDPRLRLFDTTVVMQPRPGGYDVRSGHEDYERAHLPGAAFMDLLAELADPAHRLRFMLPPEAQFTAVMSRLGIGPGAQVVLYNSGPSWWATRAFFMLRAFGFDDVRVLDGGLDRWRREGRRIESGARAYPPARFEVRERRPVFVGRDEVLQATRTGDRLLMHALAPAVFRGEVAPYGRPGRIPGSVNVFAAELLGGEDRVFLSPAELRARFTAAGALGERPTITYCGGGISATTNAFALLMLGRDDVQIYDASMSEWGPDASLPMESDV